MLPEKKDERSVERDDDNISVDGNIRQKVVLFIIADV
jgi:hypothetical protein